MHSLSREEFDQVVGEALRGLPDLFQDHLENVVIAVRDDPGPEAGDLAGPGLMGLYHGVPLSRRSVWQNRPLPDRIFLYQRNIERASRSRSELLAQIRTTLLHEVGHHFGMNEAQVRDLGL